MDGRKTFGFSRFIGWMIATQLILNCVVIVYCENVDIIPNEVQVVPINLPVSSGDVDVIPAITNNDVTLTPLPEPNEVQLVPLGDAEVIPAITDNDVTLTPEPEPEIDEAPPGELVHVSTPDHPFRPKNIIRLGGPGRNKSGPGLATGRGMMATMIGAGVKANEISSPLITDWGTWGAWDMCPPNTYASAFQLKTDSIVDHRDNTALNGVRLYCTALGSPTSDPEKYVKVINSTEGNYGKWGQTFECGSIFTGFKLRAVPNKGTSYTLKSDTDDLAATNFGAVCKPNGEAIEGDGIDEGDWSRVQACKFGEAVCGIQTEVDLTGGGTLVTASDETGLNNIKLRCCLIPNPNSVCQPHDDWDLVSECDNMGGTENKDCEFIKYRGIVRDQHELFTKEHIPEINALRELGYVDDVTPLSQNFQANLNGPRQGPGILWRLETSPKTWAAMTSSPYKYYAPANTKLSIYQVVGHCGTFTVLSSQFRTAGFNATDYYQQSQYWTDE